MRRCSLCKKKQNANGSFFSVPKDERRRNVWSQICNVNFTACAFVCMDHFAPSDIVKGPKTSYLLPSAIPRVPVMHKSKFLNTANCNQLSDIRAQVIFTETESNKRTAGNNVLVSIPVEAGMQFPNTREVCVVKTINFPVVQPKDNYRDQETQTDPVTILESNDSKKVLYSKIRSLNSKINELELKLLQTTGDIN